MPNSDTESLPVTFFQPDLCHSVETMALFIADDPRRKVRVVTSLAPGAEATEHPWCVRRLTNDSRIEVVDWSAPAQRSSLLVFALTRRGRMPAALRPWLDRAAAAAFRPEPDRYASRADWVRELMRSFPFYLRARIAIFEREPNLLDLRFGRQRRIRYARTVHPQFLSLPALRAAMFGPVDPAPRRFRIAFMGNRQPPERAVRLEAMRRALTSDPRVRIVGQYPSARGGDLEAMWLEYGIAGTVGGLDPVTYTRALSDSDFCLSPPGWSRWAHRTVEALVRGTIPVIEDASLYALDLRDGENCILVAGQDWAAAVRRCAAMSAGQIAGMRRRVLLLREGRLFPEIAGREFRAALFQERQ